MIQITYTIKVFDNNQGDFSRTEKLAFWKFNGGIFTPLIVAGGCILFFYYGGCEIACHLQDPQVLEKRCVLGWASLKAPKKGIWDLNSWFRKCPFGMLSFCICLKFHSEWQPRFYYSGTVMVLFSEKHMWFWSRINGLSFQSHLFLQTFFKKPWCVLEVAWKVIQNG